MKFPDWQPLSGDDCTIYFDGPTSFPSFATIISIDKDKAIVADVYGNKLEVNVKDLHPLEG